VSFAAALFSNVVHIFGESVTLIQALGVVAMLASICLVSKA